MSTPTPLTLDQIDALLFRNAATLQPLLDHIVAQGLAIDANHAMTDSELKRLIGIIPHIVADTIEESCGRPPGAMTVGEQIEALGRIIRLTFDAHTMGGIMAHMAFTALRLTSLPVPNLVPTGSIN